MSDKKIDKEVNKEDVLEVIDVDEFSSVDSVSDDLNMDVSDIENDKTSEDSDNKETVIDAEIGKSSFDGEDSIPDVVMEMEEETEADDDSIVDNYIDDGDEIPETDDFDDLEDDDLVAGAPMAGVKVKKSSNTGKLVVGVLALLSVGAVGYYMFLPKESASLPSIQIPSVEPIAAVSLPVSDSVNEEILEFGTTDSDVPYMTEIVGDLDDDIIDVSNPLDDDGYSSMDVAPSVAPDSVGDITDDAIDVAEVVSEDVIDVTGDVIDVTGDVIDNYGDVEGGDDFDGDDILNISEQTADDMGIILSDSSAEIDGADSSSEEESISMLVPMPSKKDVYFDSVQEVIQRDASLQDVGPTEVNPIVEPASKYIVVSNVSSKDSVESKVMQAKRALKLGRYDAAYDFYDRLYKVNPRDEAILMGRAVSLHELGRKRAAIDAYEDLLSLHPDNADALVNLLGLVNGEHPAVALQRLLSLRGSHPDNDGVVAQIAFTYATMNNAIDAKRYMNIAMGMAPQNAQHPYNLAVMYDRDGDTSNAIKYYDEALSVDAIHGGGRSLNRDVIYDRLIKLR